MSTLLKRIGVDLPIIQAPMAGTSTPEMAAAVSNAGALGSIAVGATGSLCRESGGYTTPFGERPSRIVSGDVLTLPVPARRWCPAVRSR